MKEEVDFTSLLPKLNLCLGGEIRLDAVCSIPRTFNLIQSVKRKTYRYFFSDADYFHPFASAFMTSVSGINSLEQMQLNATQFVGTHDFSAFCKISGNKSDFIREVLEVQVFEASDFTAEFFPEKSCCIEVTGTGFLTHQVRKMVTALWFFTPSEIRERLENPTADWTPVPTASANGLVLWETELTENFGME
jgi:tRNA pseudouridine38-40 synthase